MRLSEISKSFLRRRGGVKKSLPQALRGMSFAQAGKSKYMYPRVMAAAQGKQAARTFAAGDASRQAGPHVGAGQAMRSNSRKVLALRRPGGPA